MRSRLLWPVLATALVLVGCEAEPDVPPSSTPAEPGDVESVREATVQILAGHWDTQGGFVHNWSGSGSIVDPSGLILTNAHVAAPEAPGQEILYAGSENHELEATNPEVLVVGVYVGEDQYPEYRYLAEVLTADGWLDLAVLRIVSDLDENPVPNLDLPYLRLGDSDTVRGGDRLTVVGYPGEGGPLITTLPAESIGFFPDDKIADLTRGWIKYATAAGPGVSGGVGVDEDLLLVGVPTRGGLRFGHLRPINLAKQLVADAAAGHTYVRGEAVVKGSGQQKLTLVGWSTEVHEGGCPVNPGPTVPSGISLMYVGFEYSGFTNGEDVAWQWLISGEPWYQESTYNSEGWKFNESGDCFPIPGTWEDGRRLPDGQYRVIVYAGETLRLIADESVEVGGDAVPPPEEGVLIAARVVDQDSRQPIAGAVVVFLEPGTDPKAWREEVPQDRTKVVATSAKTTTAGHVAFDNPLEPGVAYPWVIEMPEGTTGYGPWYYKTNGYLVPELNVNVDFSVFKRP